MTAGLDEVSVGDLEVSVDSLDLAAAAAIYREYGCLVVRGLMVDYLDDINVEINQVIAETIDLIPKASKVTEGWSTPNGALLLPAPEGQDKDAPFDHLQRRRQK